MTLTITLSAPFFQGACKQLLGLDAGQHIPYAAVRRHLHEAFNYLIRGSMSPSRWLDRHRQRKMPDVQVFGRSCALDHSPHLFRGRI